MVSNRSAILATYASSRIVTHMYKLSFVYILRYRIPGCSIFSRNFALHGWQPLIPLPECSIIKAYMRNIILQCSTEYPEQNFSGFHFRDVYSPRKVALPKLKVPKLLYYFNQAQRRLHKNAASGIEQVLKATLHKIAVVQPPTTHHENHPS